MRRPICLALWLILSSVAGGYKWDQCLEAMLGQGQSCSWTAVRACYLPVSAIFSRVMLRLDDPSCQ
eukprot:289075-Chlamydomonas_euryale.AAC.7